MPRLTTRKCDSTSAKGPPASSAFWSFRAADPDCRPASQEFLAQLLVPCDPSCIPTAAISTFDNSSTLLSRLKLSLFDKMGASEAGPGVGFEFPRFDVAWKKRDLLLFASSMGLRIRMSCTFSTYVPPSQFGPSHRESETARHIKTFSLTPTTGTQPLLRRLPHLSHHPPLQTHRLRSHRLLRPLQLYPHRRRPQFRHQACARRRAQNGVPQAHPREQRG